MGLPIWNVYITNNRTKIYEEKSDKTKEKKIKFIVILEYFNVVFSVIDITTRKNHQ